MSLATPALGKPGSLCRAGATSRPGKTPRLKDRCMHGVSRRRALIGPSLKIVDPVERLMGAQEQAIHIATERGPTAAKDFREPDEREQGVTFSSG